MSDYNQLISAGLGRDPARRAIYIAGMMPGILYFYWGLTDQLGADPQNVLERALGLWSLRFLIAGLAITPIRRLGGPNLIRYRRALGLLAFYYASLHVMTYVVIDKQIDFASILADILRRPYITIGMLAFTVLAPLAATSNGPMVRWLGTDWRRLHRLVYLAAAAAALHFVMLTKVWALEPLIYGAAVAALLLLRFLRVGSAGSVPRRPSP